MQYLLVGKKLHMPGSGTEKEQLMILALLDHAHSRLLYHRPTNRNSFVVCTELEYYIALSNSDMRSQPLMELLNGTEYTSIHQLSLFIARLPKMHLHTQDL